MRHTRCLNMVIRICLLATLLSPSAGLASPIEDHRQITLESLDAVVQPSPSGSPPGTQSVYRFTPAAAEQVANANRDMDVASEGGWLAFAPSDEHAEDGLVAQSRRRIDDLQREIVVSLMLVKSTHPALLESVADRSRVLLGEALHTTQDIHAETSPDYPSARVAGLTASILLVQTILAQLESAGAQRSICFFLGRDNCGEPDASP